MWLPAAGLLTSLLAVSTAPVWAVGSNDVDSAFFDVSFGDLQVELEEAREQGKHGIFVFFEMDECPFCHRMRRTILNQPEVQSYFSEHFFNTRIDIEGDVILTTFDGREMSQKDFAFREHRVRATPVLMFFDLSGQPVARYTGATASADEFLLLGEYVVSQSYSEMPFTRYKRMKRNTVSR